MGRPLELSLLAIALALVAARELWVDTAAILTGQLTGTPGISATLLEVFLLLSICLAHLAVEKPNWQMFGVYIVSVFSVVVGSIWLIHPDSGTDIHLFSFWSDLSCPFTVLILPKRETPSFVTAATRHQFRCAFSLRDREITETIAFSAET